jgi:hypothetical protein
VSHVEIEELRIGKHGEVVFEVELGVGGLEILCRGDRIQIRNVFRHIRASSSIVCHRGW